MGQELTPQSRLKPNQIRQELNYFAKNQSTGPPKIEARGELKDRIVSIGYKGANKNRSIIDDILPVGPKK